MLLAVGVRFYTNGAWSKTYTYKYESVSTPRPSPLDDGTFTIEEDIPQKGDLAVVEDGEWFKVARVIGAVEWERYPSKPGIDYKFIKLRIQNENLRSR